MIDYFCCTPAGEVVSRGTCQDAAFPVLAARAVQAGLSAHHGDASPGRDYVDVVDGVPVVQALPEQTSTAHTFDYIGKAWIDSRTLADLKAAKWAEIKQQRDTLEVAGFPYMGKVIDSDARSVQRITTAVQAADAAQRAGQPFSIEWTCADNSTLALDGPAMQGMPVALATYANSLHEQARLLRQQIESASSAAEVDSLVW